MNKYIVYLLIAALITPLSFAQQNKSTPEQEIETLKKQVSELQNKLQTVENVEKMELAAKLAEANAKLANTEIDKYKRELKDANDEWLRTWSSWFLTVIGIFTAILIGVSAVFWFWLRSRADKLIADSAEKSLNGFKEAVGQVNILKDHLRVLEKEYAVPVLENFMNFYSIDEDPPEQIRALPERALLDIFGDETRRIEVRYEAAHALAARKSTRLVSPLLEFLNSVVDSDLGSGEGFETERYLHKFLGFLMETSTLEAYQGLTNLLNRLLTEVPKHTDLFLTRIVLSLLGLSLDLNMKESVSILRKAIPHLNDPDPQLQHEALSILSGYFDIFNAPEGIKEILTHHTSDEMHDVETECLAFLKKHDPDFVQEWKDQKETANTENEESS